MDPKNRIKQLVEDLNRYSEEYYIYDSPTISDFEYDALLRELEELEKAYPEYVLPESPTRRVGDYMETKLEKIVFDRGCGSGPAGNVHRGGAQREVYRGGYPERRGFTDVRAAGVYRVSNREQRVQQAVFHGAPVRDDRGHPPQPAFRV